MTAPQKEHCEHEPVCISYPEKHYGCKPPCDTTSGTRYKCPHDTRSRPSPSPQKHDNECIHRNVCKFECDEGDFEHPCPHRISTYNPIHYNHIRNAAKQEEYDRVTKAWKEWMMLHVPAPTYHEGLGAIESLRASKEQP